LLLFCCHYAFLLFLLLRLRLPFDISESFHYYFIKIFAITLSLSHSAILAKYAFFDTPRWFSFRYSRRLQRGCIYIDILPAVDMLFCRFAACAFIIFVPFYFLISPSPIAFDFLRTFQPPYAAIEPR